MKKTLKVMNDLKKEGVIEDYAIAGAIAALKWVEPFFTRDLDILVLPLQAARKEEIISFVPIYDALKAKGYDQWTGQWLMIEGVPVEFLPAEGLSKEAVDEAVKTEFEGIETRVVTPEYLIPLFLKASRKKDMLKIELLLDQTRLNREKLMSILTHYGLDEKFKNCLGDRK